jgi:hypothetical protein
MGGHKKMILSWVFRLRRIILFFAPCCNSIPNLVRLNAHRPHIRITSHNLRSAAALRNQEKRET